MQQLFNIAMDASDLVGQVVILEATPGQARRKHIQQWLEQAASTGAATWLLDCDRDDGGPWAGLRDLLADLVPAISATAPNLLAKHDYELAVILPRIRRTLAVRNPTLTDSAPAAERVRNYPADRAFRICHGVIDLLSDWHRHTPDTHWVIACDSYTQAGPLVQRFFTELARRRGQALKLTLLVTAEPGTSAAQAAQFAQYYPAQVIQLDLPGEPAAPASPQEMIVLAEHLEAQIGDDPHELDHALPALIRQWRLTGQPEPMLKYTMKALNFYGTQGLYEDAVVYGRAALSLLDEHWPGDILNRCRVQMKLYNCHIGLRQIEFALEALKDITAHTDNPEFLQFCCYMRAMLHTRYMAQHDFALAEAYLEQGLIETNRTSLPEPIKVFHRVFNRNGLALVRHFQGRPDEAIQLCQWGFAELNAHLSPDQHKLHRSVLLYNTAQVYSSIRDYEGAIAYFTAAMQMDPNYSEYYNERGNMYLKAGRLAEAEQDYLQAIELSPPYSEVWTNLGQCYRLMGRLQEARAAYDRALDLDPAQPVPFTGRAEICEELGLLDQALADYTAALALKPNQPLVLSNRAILHYQLGDLPQALEDLNRAILLAPAMADLYQNRAVALTELERLDEAAQNLQMYLQLSPDAEDRAEVEQKLAVLRAETPVM